MLTFECTDLCSIKLQVIGVDVLHVVSGNIYSIKNLRNDEARLLVFQLKNFANAMQMLPFPDDTTDQEVTSTGDAHTLQQDS